VNKKLRLIYLPVFARSLETAYAPPPRKLVIFSQQRYLQENQIVNSECELFLSHDVNQPVDISLGKVEVPLCV